MGHKVKDSRSELQKFVRALIQCSAWIIAAHWVRMSTMRRFIDRNKLIEMQEKKYINRLEVNLAQLWPSIHFFQVSVFPNPLRIPTPNNKHSLNQWRMRLVAGWSALDCLSPWRTTVMVIVRLSLRIRTETCSNLAEPTLCPIMNPDHHPPKSLIDQVILSWLNRHLPRNFQLRLRKDQN